MYTIKRYRNFFSILKIPAKQELTEGKMTRVVEYFSTYKNNKLVNIAPIPKSPLRFSGTIGYGEQSLCLPLCKGAHLARVLCSMQRVGGLFIFYLENPEGLNFWVGQN